MALFDIFQKAKKVQELKTHKVEAVSPKPKKISGQAFKVLRMPHVTEKATDLVSKNQYIFKIFKDSNKNQVKKAVENVYGVDVAKVRIINIAKKRRRLGRIEGWSQGYKKAIVTIKEGQKIEVLSR